MGHSISMFMQGKTRYDNATAAIDQEASIMFGFELLFRTGARRRRADIID